jgi:N-acetylglucosamine transport system substrate-binding protein
MKKVLVRMLSVLCAGVMLFTVIAGCGTAKTDTSGTTTGDSSAAAKAAATSAETATGDTGKNEFENKTLDFYMFEGGYGKAAEEAIVAKFEETYGVKVNMVSSPKIGEILRPKMISGMTPDVIMMNLNDSSGIVQALVKEKSILELTPMLDEKALDSDSTVRDTFLSGFLDCSFTAPYGDGTTYLLPLLYSPQGLIYNKDYFDKKGLKAPKTWDDFFALGEAAKKDGRALFTYQGIYPSYLEIMLYPAIASANGIDGYKKYVNYEAGSFKNDAVKQVLTNFQDISKKGYLLKGTTAMNHTQSQTAMMQGQALFIPCGSWMEGEMKDAPREEGFQFAMCPAPTLTADGKQYASVGLETILIPKAAKNPELAKEFLKFMVTQESQKVFAEKASGIEPVKGTLDLCKSIISENLYNFYAMFNGDVLPLVDSLKALPDGCKVVTNDEIWVKPTSKVMNDQMTVDQWMEDVEKAFAQIRDDFAKAEQK